MNSLQIGTSSLTYFYMQPPLQSPSKIHSSSSANFHLFIPCYMFTKPSLWSQLTLPFPIAQQFLSPFSFAQPSLQFLHKKHFPYLSHGSLWKADSVLISAFFLEVWAEKKGTQALIHFCSGSENWCIAGNSLWWRCLQSKWKTIQSTFTHTFTHLFINNPLIP